MSKRYIAASSRPSTRLQKKQRVDEDVESWIEEQKAERLERYNALNERRSQLAPLPEPVPRPAYDYEPRVKSEDDFELEIFYRACAGGDEDTCRRFVTDKSPSQPELAFALEEASFHFQIPVVKFLLEHTPLHFRCFRRSEEHPHDLATNERNETSTKCVSQSVFSSGSSKLLPLLKVYLEHGLHPNQLIGPLQKSRPIRLFTGAVHEVALHYPRCISDTAILKLLLEAGADPTIAREQFLGGQRDVPRLERPVRRLEGFILDKAANVGTPETVDLILAHGASVDMGLGLYTLARPYRSDGSLCLLSELEQKMNGKLSKPWDEHKEVALQFPESPSPELPLEKRLAMAGHLLSHGADINQLRNIYEITGRHTLNVTPVFETTPLYHAVAYRDWSYVEWLLDNGADPKLRPNNEAQWEDYAYRYDVRGAPFETDNPHEKFKEILERRDRERSRRHRALEDILGDEESVNVEQSTL